MFTSSRPSPRQAFAAYGDVGARTGVEGASPHKLVSLLFDKLAGEVACARGALLRADVPEKCRAIGHAVRIVEEGLAAPLDMKAGGALAQNLRDVYDYIVQRLTLANLKNDAAMLDECSRLVQTLREGWDGIAPPIESPALTATAA